MNMSDLSKIDLRDLFALKSDLLISADLVRNKSVKGRLVEHAGLISRLIAERVSEKPATQPAAGEPVAWMTRPRKGSYEGHEFLCQPDDSLNMDQWEKPFPVYAAPPAAAHGDKAVQYRLLRVGEVIKATDELLMDDCTTWHPMGDGPQIGIGWGWHAGLMPVRRIDAAMRAQGDGEVQ